MMSETTVQTLGSMAIGHSL